MNIPLISLLLVTLSIIVAGQIGHLAYSQTAVNNTELLPIPESKPKSPTSDNGSQIKEGFSLYHSPELGFDIAYPSDWFVEEPEMVSDLKKYGVYINAPTSTQSNNLTKEEQLEKLLEKTESILSGESESTDVFMKIDVRNKTAEDPDNIKTIGVQTILAKKEGDPSINIIEASETTLAGLPAFKIVYTYTSGLSTSGIKEMSIEALSDNQIYTISYVSPSYLYDVYLPEVEYAINSTKINN